MRTLIIALALAGAPLTLSAQEGGQQGRVPERAARQAAEIQSRQPAKGANPAVRATREGGALSGVRKPPKARPARTR
jgi:hypothetical protein